MEHDDQVATAGIDERPSPTRILARYRKLILLGRAQLPMDAARRLVGPDCAYHLYGLGASDARPRDDKQPSRRTTPVAPTRRGLG